jgi:hypothetical protein
VRSALIPIAGQPLATADRGVTGLAGKSLARRQLDFALAAGAEQIILLGDGAAPEAIALRHIAENAGAKVLTIADGHGLLGAIRAADHLLVLAPGVLPDAPGVLEMLGKGSSLLVVPAAQGVAAGFERIDLERAWAGALVVQGGLVERLAELAPDSDPAPALLRIALQARVAERCVPEALLADGSWAMLRSDADAAAAERAWMKRNLPEAPGNRPAGWLATLMLRMLATRLLQQQRAAALLAGAAAALLVAAVASSLSGWASAGFVLVALGVLGSELSAGVSRLVSAPFAPGKRGRAMAVALALAVDLALTTCAVLAIQQDWLHRLFPPLVLIGLLYALRPETWPGARALVGDRLLLSLLFGIAAVVGVAEAAVMALALLTIGLRAVQVSERRG